MPESKGQTNIRKPVLSGGVISRRYTPNLRSTVRG